MKIRNGFVSNSSSSSFIIDAEQYSLKKIKKYMKDIIKAENNLSDVPISRDLESFCIISEVDDVTDFFREVAEYNDYEDKLSAEIKEKYLAEWKERFPGKCIRIDSVTDNSIPWAIQDKLGDIGYRQHWG